MPGAQVELFESGDRLGGVLDTHRTGELLIERGADSFLNTQPWAVSLCEELGLGGELIPTNPGKRRALVVRGGRSFPVPAGFVVSRPQRIWPLLRSPLLSWRGKGRVLCEPWVKSPPSAHDSDYDESVASFATRRLGREVFEWLVQPLLAGIYTADAYQLSVAATMPEALAAEREHGSLLRAAKGATSTDSGARYAHFVTLRGGLGQLVDRLTNQVGVDNIHLNCPVNRIETAGGQWNLYRADGIDSAPFQGVVVATPAPRAAEVVQDFDPQLNALLGQIPYASSAVVSLSFRHEQIGKMPEGFGLVVPTVENRPIVAASFSSAKFPGRAPDSQVLVRVFLGGALRPELMELDDKSLTKIAASQMKELLGVRGDPLEIDLVRWREKMPQYHVGHVRLVAAIEERVAKHVGLELAGNAYHGVGIPQCIHSADTAAARLVEQVTKR